MMTMTLTLAISGTNGSSGFGSVRRLQMESKTWEGGRGTSEEEEDQR